MDAKQKDPHEAGLFAGCCDLFSGALVAGHPHAVEEQASIAVEVPDALEVEEQAVTAAAAPVSIAAEEPDAALVAALVAVEAAVSACSEAARDEPAALAEAGPAAPAAALAVSAVGKDEPEAVAESAYSPAVSAGPVAVRACCPAALAEFEDQAGCRGGWVVSVAVQALPPAEPVWSVAARDELRVARAWLQVDQDALVESAVYYLAALGG